MVELFVTMIETKVNSGHSIIHFYKNQISHHNWTIVLIAWYQQYIHLILPPITPLWYSIMIIYILILEIFTNHILFFFPFNDPLILSSHQYGVIFIQTLCNLNSNGIQHQILPKSFSFSICELFYALIYLFFFRLGRYLPIGIVLNLTTRLSFDNLSALSPFVFPVHPYILCPNFKLFFSLCAICSSLFLPHIFPKTSPIEQFNFYNNLPPPVLTHLQKM
jgi:hypothetical protein